MIRWHATYYLNYTAYWCNAKISALLSIGIPTPQLLYTIPQTGIFPHWYKASWQCDNMPLWVLAICHKAMLFAKGKIMSLCVPMYTLCVKAENLLHILMPSRYAHRLFWSLSLGKKILFNVEGTNILKHHSFSNISWSGPWKLHPHRGLQKSSIDTWAVNVHPIVHFYLWSLGFCQVSVNVGIFALARVFSIFKCLSKT